MDYVGLTNALVLDFLDKFFVFLYPGCEIPILGHPHPLDVKPQSCIISLLKDSRHTEHLIAKLQQKMELSPLKTD